MVEVQVAPRLSASRLTALRPARIDGPALSAWTLAFALVSYLALRGGGYDIAVRSQVGALLWWIVLVGALAGILPSRLGARAWVAVGLLAAFTAWTGLAISWSQSAEQSVIELGRLAAYLGVLVLAVALQGRTAARHTLNGLTSAFALVTVLAVLSRLLPGIFGHGQHLQFLGTGSARKLSYPLGYWNALAGFAAMGVPLLLSASLAARSAVGRATAAALLPLSVLCIYLTVSRGGVLALGVGLAVFLLLVPRRLSTLGVLLPAAGGAALLLTAVASRHALASALPTRAAADQGTTVLALALAVCPAVGLIRHWGARRLPGMPAVLTPGRRALTRRALAVAAVLLLGALAAGLPARLEHVWHDFKQPSGVVTPGSEASVFTRLQAANGNSRYQFWQSALEAEETRPWGGIGPGTYQFWWAPHATAPGFIRNAHSLYFETLAETGIVGLALLGGLWLWLAWVAARRVLREPVGMRLWLAGAAASLATFLFAAALEWVWQLAAMAAAALVLGAVIAAGRPEDAADHAPTIGIGSRAVALAVALAALAAILVPLAGHLAVRDSQAAAARGQLGQALADSLAAARLQPYSSSAHLQEALVLEAAGDFRRAAAAARVATADSPTDWTTWLTLARIEVQAGDSGAALRALRQARALNPLSPWFSR